MNDLISVIIPFYEVPGIQLRYCIDSFLQQSYRNFELIIIDDGNVNSTYEELINVYEKKDKRIKFLHQEKSGVSEARNNGIKQASGKYIVFCDSDDFVESNFLAEMYCNMVYNDLVICSVAEQWFPVINSRSDFQYFVSQPSQYNYPQYVNFSVNKMYKKSILDKYAIHFDSNMQMGEDALFVSSYLQHCQYIKCISNNLYHYRWNEFSAMHKYNPSFWEDEKKVIERQYELFHAFPLNDKEEKFMERWLYIKFKDAFYYYLHSLQNKNDIKKYIDEIVEYNLFKKVVHISMKKNKLFNKNDRIILSLWKIFGANGAMFMQYGSKLKHFLLYKKF